jgi:hypothetical protein
MTVSPHQKAVFNAFFADHLPRLSDKYSWPLKKPKQPLRVPTSGHELQGNGMDECITLKKHLTQEWANATEAATKKQLAQWIVSDWGGVRTNGPDTIDSYITSITSGDFSMPLQGVASYSKILSIVDCHQYAIYDARVVASLNALQLLMNAPSPLFFTYIPGRNKVIHGNKKADGFVKTFPKSKLVKHGWTVVPADESYTTYMELLHSLKSDFPSHEIYHFEMTLFSMAPELCEQAIKMNFL